MGRESANAKTECVVADVFLAVEGSRFALRTNAHLNDDAAVAKMGHPLWLVGKQGEGVGGGCIYGWIGEG